MVTLVFNLFSEFTETIGWLCLKSIPLPHISSTTSSDYTQ
jgi:hypothetical protein